MISRRTLLAGAGGAATLALSDRIIPAAPIPFDDARDAVTAAWRADALHAALVARAEEIRTAVQNGAPLADFGTVATTEEIARDGTLPSAPASVVETAFGMEEGAAQVVDAPDWVGILRLDAIRPAPQDGEGAAALKGQIAAQLEGALAQDAQQMFTQSVADRAGIQINQSVIDAVHAQIP